MNNTYITPFEIERSFLVLHGVHGCDIIFPARFVRGRKRSAQRNRMRDPITDMKRRNTLSGVRNADLVNCLVDRTRYAGEKEILDKQTRHTA